MKSKKISIWSIVVVFFLLLTACNGNATADTYVSGQDYQYGQIGTGQFQAPAQEGENGIYYFLAHGFIYYLDEATDTLLPLCNKADCLHDQEPDSSLWENCNAYVGDPNDVEGIAYCDGAVYCMNKRSAYDELDVLYRLAGDGSKKEIAYQLDEGSSCLEWMVHRNVLYYTEKWYTTEEDSTVAEHYAFKSYPLTGLFQQPKVIYEPPEEVAEVFSLGSPQAYGNYIYFIIDAYPQHGDVEITDDNYLDYLYVKTYIYNTQTEELTELRIPDQQETECVEGVVFWQDKILYEATPYGTPYITTNVVTYQAELDGSDLKVFGEFPKGYVLVSDGSYLYLTNSNMVARGKEEGPAWYQVYNSEQEQIDSLVLPVDFGGSAPLGNSQTAYWMWYSSDDEESDNWDHWGVYCWDKSGIGGYQGGEVTVTKLAAR